MTEIIQTICGLLALAIFTMPIWILFLMGLIKVTVGHRWSYHNPYDRRCKVCDRHEVEYLYWTGANRWEAHDYGNPGYKCSYIPEDDK